jgi:hypothetical protein
MKNKTQKAISESGHVLIEAQGNLLKLSLKTTGQISGGGARGSITSFSRRSRKNMLETMARLDEEKLGFVSFVTLTYPDNCQPPTFEESTDNRKAFLKRLQRRFPEASGIWRREWEDRKSGKHAGVFYPHFHLLFFNLPFVHYEELNRHWCEVLKYDGYLRTEIKAVENWRQAFYYVAKYMAKPEGYDLAEDAAPFSPLVNPELSDNAEAIGFDESGTVSDSFMEDNQGLSSADKNAAPKAFFDGGEAAAGSLVYNTKQAATDKLNTDVEEDIGETGKPKTGRHWGVFNRKKLPFATLESKSLPAGKWLDEAKRIASEIYPPIGNCEYTGGFTLFTENAGEYKQLMQALPEAEGGK